MFRAAALAAMLALSVPLAAHAGVDEGVEAFQAGDFEKARAEFAAAADAGDAIAQFHLGSLYDTGKGVPYDLGEAMRWYRRAALQGDPSAQFNLAVLYEGEDAAVPRDLIQSYVFYTLSALNQGPPYAVRNRADVEDRMTAEEIEVAGRLVIEFKPIKENPDAKPDAAKAAGAQTGPG